MRTWGLTGGIATGKSTVGRMLVEAGFPLVDADEVARDVVAPGSPVMAEIAARFPGVVDAQGLLNRTALGDRIFSSPAERAALNAITHPRIRDAVKGHLQRFAQAGATDAIYDAPLLIENRLHEGLAGVILVTTPREVQIERLMKRNGFSRAQAEARLASQMPIDAKRPFATFVIDNGGGLGNTKRQVSWVIDAIRALRTA